ncbi:cytochrome ubiquinol oxidase subunit I [Salinisphaera hydrothermalis]|uniref:Cytochrome d terminal oxidase, polypeptide subunit I n=1 Tax=Salinisphaera hydrothermalis (strain C41B8) TaxID=1304275 RepID=A0A084IJC2_SALHC|nr:cytochrome ubiquinol oxidase subunit I [Salinisphaera hydrothermalis]KEZ76806.1 cytochrome d terminal oxidase, polypeptide subunit I [Salinisphaera hydrothermalis C41B8]
MHSLDTVVDLSRWQFAATVLYHFIFVPLTLGLSMLLATIETVYVITGRAIYRQMTLFWSKLFAINFALGVATGLTMEFQFGTNWSTYSHYVGDIFGAPLAIEGLMAFFLESTMVGLMLFGWGKLSRGKHLLVTYMVALGSNLSALWILIANGYMQSPVGSTFNPATMRMELTSFSNLVFNPDAQAKFVHTSIAGYLTAAMFVLGISAFYMLRKRHIELAKRSFRVAALFGIFASIAVICLGDALGFINGADQPTKLAAMEGLWKTAPAPAGFNLIAWPNQAEQKNEFELQIPYLLTPLVTHSFTESIPGVDALEKQAAQRIRNGIPALVALKTLREHPNDAAALAQFNAHKADLGYARLVQRYAPDVSNATGAQIQKAAADSIPPVAPVFWSFRIMVAAAFLMLGFLILAVNYSLRGTIVDKRWFLKVAPWMIPVPFIANEAGWLVAELGRQPWTVYEQLPTWISASTHSVGYMIFSLTGFVLLYSIFIVIEMYLMVKYIRLGPDDDGHGATESATQPRVSQWSEA